MAGFYETTPKSSLTPYPPKGGLPNSMIFRCSPLGLGVKQMKIIEFHSFLYFLEPLTLNLKHSTLNLEP